VFDRHPTARSGGIVIGQPRGTCARRSWRITRCVSRSQKAGSVAMRSPHDLVRACCAGRDRRPPTRPTTHADV